MRALAVMRAATVLSVASEEAAAKGQFPTPFLEDLLHGFQRPNQEGVCFGLVDLLAVRADTRFEISFVGCEIAGALQSAEAPKGFAQPRSGLLRSFGRGNAQLLPPRLVAGLLARPLNLETLKQRRRLVAGPAGAAGMDGLHEYPTDETEALFTGDAGGDHFDVAAYSLTAAVATELARSSLQNDGARSPSCSALRRALEGPSQQAIELSEGSDVEAERLATVALLSAAFAPRADCRSYANANAVATTALVQMQMPTLNAPSGALDLAGRVLSSVATSVQLLIAMMLIQTTLQQPTENPLSFLGPYHLGAALPVCTPSSFRRRWRRWPPAICRDHENARRTSSARQAAYSSQPGQACHDGAASHVWRLQCCLLHLRTLRSACAHPRPAEASATSPQRRLSRASPTVV